jgi:guanylate kinase
MRDEKHYNQSMIILVGASASGKTEVAKLLAKKYGIVKAITHTTRPMRKDEKNGVDYFFVAKAEFEKLLLKDAFAEHTLYNDNYYGCSKAQIADGKAVIVDPNGLKAFKKLNNKRIISFLMYADEKIRLERMLSRGDDANNAKSRILNDRVDFSFNNIGKTDFVIDTSKASIDEIADDVYRKYIQSLKSV